MKNKKLTPEQRVKRTEKQNRRAEALAELEADRKSRVEKTGKEIADILDKNNCELSVAMIITPQGNIPKLDIIAKD